MTPRANWNGYLKLSLVSCPVALYPASSTSEKVSFHRINRQTGNRLKQLLADAGTEEPVSKEDITRGYEAGRREYIEVADEELEKIQIESTHTIDIGTFVPRDEIDGRYLNSPYYIVPNDMVGQEAFAVIRNAIQAKGMAALAHVVLTRREHVIMLEPFGKGLLGMTLRYPYEVREAESYFDEIPDLKLPSEMRQLAVHIVESKAGHFEPEKFADHYEAALISLLKAKQAGRVIEAPKEEVAPKRVVNLMDALRASIEAGQKRKPAAPSAKAGNLQRGRPQADGDYREDSPFTGRANRLHRPAALAVLQARQFQPDGSDTNGGLFSRPIRAARKISILSFDQLFG